MEIISRISLCYLYKYQALVGLRAVIFYSLIILHTPSRVLSKWFLCLFTTQQYKGDSPSKMQIKSDQTSVVLVSIWQVAISLTESQAKNQIILLHIASEHAEYQGPEELILLLDLI